MGCFKKNYYFSSFFWSTLQKILTAIVGFVSVPLLLKYYGSENYGILSLAMACNGYMHLLDLGMNVGAVRYFSLWWSQNNTEKVNRVARTNITFYSIIAFVNAALLVSLAYWGESLFSTSHDQFLQLRTCLLILALFSMLSWGATTFQQLLIAAKKLAYTSQIQIFQTLLKLALVGLVFKLELSLTSYFFVLTLIISCLIVPYALKCRKDKLVDSIKPAFYWKDFKVVIIFCLSIFLLSLFQVTASQSRPIILGIFSTHGPLVNTEFRILEVVPQLIITISATVSSMFLPKTTELIAKGAQTDICKFAYKWTFLTTIITCCLCFPFILGANEVLSAYVGSHYSYLSAWFMLWVFITFIQMHCTPAYSLILAKGETKVLICITGCSCILSLILNIIFAERYGVGSAIIAYSIYVMLNMISYYFIFYSRILGLSKIKIIVSFLKPTLLAFIALVIVYLLHLENFFNSRDLRVTYIVVFMLKTFCWVLLYYILMVLFKQISIRNKEIITIYD